MEDTLYDRKKKERIEKKEERKKGRGEVGRIKLKFTKASFLEMLLGIIYMDPVTFPFF